MVYQRGEVTNFAYSRAREFDPLWKSAVVGIHHDYRTVDLWQRYRSMGGGTVGSASAQKSIESARIVFIGASAYCLSRLFQSPVLIRLLQGRVAETALGYRLIAVPPQTGFKEYIR